MTSEDSMLLLQYLSRLTIGHLGSQPVSRAFWGFFRVSLSYHAKSRRVVMEVHPYQKMRPHKEKIKSR
jgi:hypothetical protein